ncbi:Uncharacterised protein [Mycobacteroides abscessus subsp. abscessus]|nr:Uncharacterised protein [Mycobacteroides abscessus subsp. abscessus]
MFATPNVRTYCPLGPHTPTIAPGTAALVSISLMAESSLAVVCGSSSATTIAECFPHALTSSAIVSTTERIRRIRLDSSKQRVLSSGTTGNRELFDIGATDNAAHLGHERPVIEQRYAQ